MEDGAGGGRGDARLAGSGVVASAACAGAVSAGGCGGMAGTAAGGATAGDAVAACAALADLIIENPRKARTKPTMTMPHKRK